MTRTKTATQSVAFTLSTLLENMKLEQFEIVTDSKIA